MIRKLCTILLSAFMTAPLWAQSPECPVKRCASFAPEKGQWEFSLVLGKGSNFYNEDNTFLVQNVSLANGSIGLPNGGTSESGDLNRYLKINGFNDNSLVNIVGIQGKYFFQDCWAATLQAGLNIGVTPKKDYIEGQTILDDPKIDLPDAKYVNAQTTNNWYLNLGVERYFKTRNERIHPYVGATVGFQMARIETSEPYTGRTVIIEEEEVSDQVYLPAGKAGQMFGIQAGAVAGIEYGLMDGLFLALECQPVAYRYDVIQIAPKGFDKYNLTHHNVKLLDMPVIKIGFRF